jgi:anti-sigma factor RsiW
VSTHNIDPSELLAAYADDGLEGEELEAVEAYLAEHPEAQVEVEGFRALIGAGRDLAKSVPKPDFEAMRANIVKTTKAPDTRPRVPSYWFARPAVAGFMVAAAALLFVLVWRGGNATNDPVNDPGTQPIAKTSADASVTAHEPVTPPSIEDDEAVLIAELGDTDPLDEMAELGFEDELDDVVGDEDDDFDLDDLTEDELETVLDELLAG